MSFKAKHLLLLLLLVLSQLSYAANYYFATDGDDGNSGDDPNQPFQSIGKMQEIINSLNGGDVIYLKRGSEWTGVSLSFDGVPLSSGAPIIISDYGDAHLPRPILSGEEILTLQDDNPSDSIYPYVKTGNEPIPPVELDAMSRGRRFPGSVKVRNEGKLTSYAPARHPNTNYLTTTDCGLNWISHNEDLSEGNWDNGFIAMKNVKWQWSDVQIISSSQNGFTTTDHFTIKDVVPVPDGSKFFYILNADGALDSNGEWSYTNNLLKVYWDLGTPPEEVRASTSDKIINVYNSHNIQFSNIEFIGANYHAFRMESCSGISLNNCRIADIGEVGVYCFTGCQNTQISNCEFDNNQLGSIHFNAAQGGRITNNYIHHNALQEGYYNTNNEVDWTGTGVHGYAIAIYSITNSNIEVARNFIDQTAAGIYTHNNKVTVDVTNNLISNYGKTERGDLAGIYAVDEHSTTTNPKNYTNNIILYVHAPQYTLPKLKGLPIPVANFSHGIYFDDNSCNVHAIGNTIQYADMALYTNQGINRSFRNNTISNAITHDFEHPSKSAIFHSLARTLKKEVFNTEFGDSDVISGNTIVLSSKDEIGFISSSDPMKDGEVTFDYPCLIQKDITVDNNTYYDLYAPAGSPRDQAIAAINRGYYRHSSHPINNLDTYTGWEDWNSDLASASEWNTQCNINTTTLNPGLNSTYHNRHNESVRLFKNFSNAQHTFTLSASYEDETGTPVVGNVSVDPFGSKLLFYVSGDASPDADLYLDPSLYPGMDIAYPENPYDDPPQQSPQPEPQPSTALQINFTTSNQPEVEGWININNGLARTVDLGNGISMSVPALSWGENGEINEDFPTGVSKHLSHFSGQDSEEIVLYGLIPNSPYRLNILSSRDDEDGDIEARYQSFTINDYQTEAINITGKTNALNFNNINSSSDGSIKITITREADPSSTEEDPPISPYGYINALMIEEGQPTTVIAHWPFEGDGADISGNGHEITNFGSGCFDANMAKKGSHALMHLITSTATQLGTYNFNNAITFAFWGRISYDSHSYYDIISGTSESTASSFRLYYTNNEPSIRIRSNDGTTSELAILDIPPGFFEDYGSYHHYIFSFDPINGIVRMFVDGEFHDEGDFANISLSNLSLAIGWDQGTGTCVYDDMILYDGMPNAEQIHDQIYTEQINAPTNFNTSIVHEIENQGDTYYKKWNVTFSWEDNSNNETGFIITKSASAFSPCTWMVMEAAPNTTSFTDYGVTLDPKHARVNYTIRAIHDEYNSNSEHISVIGIEKNTEGEGTIETEQESEIKSTLMELKSNTSGAEFAVVGTELTWRAVPNEGWQFKEWTGDVSSTDNPVSFTVNAPTEITAVFEEVPSTQEYNLSGKINFCAGAHTYEEGWYNTIGGQANGVFPLWNDVTLTDVSGLPLGTRGDISGNDYPDKVASTYHYLNDNNEHYLKLQNLSADSLYKLVFFGSRSTTGTERITHYTVWNPSAGVSSQTESLNADGNTSNTVAIEGIEPTNGTIDFSIRKDPNSAYGYINALEIYALYNSDKVAKELELPSSAIHYYPNPVTGMLTIEKLPEHSSLKVFNALGELVDQFDNQENSVLQLPMDAYQNGTYLIRIISEGNRAPQTLRVIKQ